jgi:predicted metal-dependent peptidase
MNDAVQVEADDASDFNVEIAAGELTGEELIRRLKDINDRDTRRDVLVTEAERRINAYDLEPSLLDMLQREPFFGSLSRNVTKVRTRRIPTACVTVTADAFIMMWNPAFFWRISPEWMVNGRARVKSMGVVMHEMYHIMLEHVLIRGEGMQYPMLANWSMDLAINCMIPRDYLPDGLLIPGEPLSIPSDSESVYRPEELEQYKQLSAFIAGLPTKEAAEFYYDKLISYITANHPNMLKDPDWGKPKDQRGDEGDSSGHGGQGDQSDQDSGQGEGQGGGSGTPDSVKQGWGRLGNFDNHATWKVSDAEREYIRQRMHDIVRSSINEADNASSAGRGWGSVPVEMQAVLRKLISRQVNWRAILRQFIGMSQRVSSASSMTKLNRRYPYIIPGKKKSRGATLHIYIDQSGSVDDEALALLFAELDALSKKVSFRVFYFDTEVDEKFIDWKRGSQHPASRRRCGGTDFNAATAHANKTAGGHDGYIIMTDGECSAPGPSVRKRAWIIAPDRNLIFETTDTVVQMTRNSKAKMA